MPIGDDTLATRRHLPHFEKEHRTYFVTFTTRDRGILPDEARDIALACCVHDHDVTYWLHTAVVMPDHVHMLFTPLGGWALPRIMQRVKGVSSRKINLLMGRRGLLWQDESFDRILRSTEDIRRKDEYISNNPVRAGLVSSPDEYRWLWREWVEGQVEDRQSCLSSFV